MGTKLDVKPNTNEPIAIKQQPPKAIKLGFSEPGTQPREESGTSRHADYDASACDRATTLPTDPSVTLKDLQ